MNNSTNNDCAYLDRNTTDAVKGLGAIIILLHHISFQIQGLPKVLSSIWYIAFPIVGLFFFLSGYGLYSSLIKNGKSYWNNFFTKRISRVLLPYVIVCLTWAIVEIILSNYSVSKAFSIAFSINYVTQMWYVWVIICVYILFYFIFKYVPDKYSLITFDTIIAIYCIISALYNPKEEMYASIIGFCVGIHYAKHSSQNKSIWQTKYSFKLALFSVAFLVLFCGRLLLAKMGIENRLLHMILRNVITLLFTILLTGLLQKFHINSRILKAFGDISYEIYIIHPFVIFSLEKYKNSIDNYNLLIVIATIAITILLSVVLHKFLGCFKNKKVVNVRK